MLRVFYGTDTIKVRQQALSYLESLKERGVALNIIDAGSYEPGMVKNAAAAVSLFGGLQAYLVDTPSEKADLEAEVIDNLKSLAASIDEFIVIEGALLAAEKKVYEKHADKMEEYKGEGKERFNTFALADALAKRDKKLLWVLWQQAIRNGIAPEELVGILWWQLKTLRLAAITPSATVAGLKDFPYRKAKSALVKFKPGELETLSRSLLSHTHESRIGREDLLISLERWILRV